MKKNQTVQWVDRETVRFVDGNRSALIWVDVEAGFFSHGRIIHVASITKWEDTGTGSGDPINSAERDKIVSVVLNCFHRQRVPCRVDDES